MTTPGNTPNPSGVEENGGDEERFEFKEAKMEDEHVWLRHQIAAQKRKEKMGENEMNANITSNMERGPLNLSMADRNLLKAKIEYQMEDYKKIRDIKMKSWMLYWTAKMEKEDMDGVKKAEDKLVEEGAEYNKRYKAIVKHFWSQAEQ